MFVVGEAMVGILHLKLAAVSEFPLGCEYQCIEFKLVVKEAHVEIC